MSSTSNSWPEAVPPVLPDTAIPLPVRNPVWNGWDVLKIALLMFLAPIVIGIPLVFAAHLFVEPKLSLMQLSQKPITVLISQLIAYVLVLLYMFAIVEGQYHRPFFEAISWNWPRRVLGFVGLGVFLLIALQGVARFLPMPKDVPFEEFFKRPLEAYLTSILAVSIGPFMEELFFRGFLYPLLARRLGMAVSILLTSAAFGLLHAIQLGFAWGAVFIIFLVGLALTMVRALTKSVGASLLVHVAYNLTLMAISFVVTSGFTHLERLNQ